MSTLYSYKATIKRGEPMPSICEICSSIRKSKDVDLSKIPHENPCFIERTFDFEVTDELRNKLLEYQPFTNSKRTVTKVCRNFVHVRSHVIRG